MYEVSISRGMEKTYPEYPRNHQNDCTEVAAMPAAMPTAFAIQFDGDTSFFSRNSSADCSERKLPTAMENASTDTSTTPLTRIAFCGTPAIAMPERSPTVETKLSSTPNTKVRRKLARDSLSENAIRLTEITLSPLSSP